MELTPTLILNLALLIVPPVALVLVFRLSVMFSCFGMNHSTMRASDCSLC